VLFKAATRLRAFEMGYSDPDRLRRDGWRPLIALRANDGVHASNLAIVSGGFNRSPSSRRSVHSPTARGLRGGRAVSSSAGCLSSGSRS